MGLLDQPIDKTAKSTQDVGDHLLDHVGKDAPSVAGAIAQAVAAGLSAQFSEIGFSLHAAAAELRGAVESAPAMVASTVSQVLNEVDGLTLSTTIVITNTITRKPQ